MGDELIARGGERDRIVLRLRQRSARACQDRRRGLGAPGHRHLGRPLSRAATEHAGAAGADQETGDRERRAKRRLRFGLVADGAHDLREQALAPLRPRQNALALALVGDIARNAARPQPIAGGVMDRHRGQAETGGAAVALSEPDFVLGDGLVGDEEAGLHGIGDELRRRPTEQRFCRPAQRALRRHEDETAGGSTSQVKSPAISARSL